MSFAEVAVDAPVEPSRTFTYRIPPHRPVQPGQLVWAPFGRRTVQGIVIALSDTSPVAATRDLLQTVEPAPLLDAPRLALAQWLSRYYRCSLYAACTPLLPPGFESQVRSRIFAAPGYAAADAANGADAPGFSGDVVAAATNNVVDAAEYAIPGTDPAVDAAEHTAVAPVDDASGNPAPDADAAPDAAAPPKPPGGNPPAMRPEMAAALAALAAKPSLPEAEFLKLLGRGASRELTRLLERGVIRREVTLPRPRIAPRYEARLLPLPPEGGGDAESGNDGGPDSDGPIPPQLKSAKQRSLLEAVQSHPEPYPVTLANKLFGSGTAAALFRRGLVGMEWVRTGGGPTAAPAEPPPGELTLTPEQETALAAVTAALSRPPDAARRQAPASFLLYGVTGSGKTEVYLRSIEAALRQGRPAIFLVPEISLTPQTMERVNARFGGRAALLHSRQTPRQQFDQWWEIRGGRYELVVGPRSALFAPLENLGLIVIDEEHEWTYKQHESPPLYHARTAALELARQTGAVVLLGSATPDVETYHRAIPGRAISALAAAPAPSSAATNRLPAAASIHPSNVAPSAPGGYPTHPPPGRPARPATPQTINDAPLPVGNPAAAPPTQPAGDTASSIPPAGDTTRPTQPAGDTARPIQPAGDTARPIQPAGDTTRPIPPANPNAGDAAPPIPPANPATGDTAPPAVGDSPADWPESPPAAGRHRLLHLPRRVSGGELAQVEICDMRRELREGNRHIFSRALSAALADCIGGGHQALLFLNRRGAASIVQCRDCGYAAACRSCQSPYTYHQALGRLVCHYCNRRRRLPAACPQCRSRHIRQLGAGTERVVDEVRQLLPGVRVERLDTDAAQSPNSGETGEIGETGKPGKLGTGTARPGPASALERLASGETQVLVGTQMVAKGLDVPNLTLVGVVLADIGLYRPDFRAGERAFGLLCQVAGRAGRGPAPGRAIIQTYSPEHYAIRAAAAQDYAALYRTELAARRQLGYPPFNQLAHLVYQHLDRAACQGQAAAAAAELRRRAAAAGRTDIAVAGPAPGMPERLRGRYRWRLLLRGQRLPEFLQGMTFPPGCTIDIDPAHTL